MRIITPHSVNILDCDKRERPNKTPKERDSSVETFRILATFTVLIVHFTGWFLGGMPERFTLEGGWDFRIGQMIMESLTVVCVNCFLIISGYFGIKLKGRALWKMYTLLVSIYIPCWIAGAFIESNWGIGGLLRSIMAFSRESYFVQCYLMLMFLSPILNAYIEQKGKKIVLYVLAFWFIEIWWEQIRGNQSLGFDSGYSVIHFVLMYMLARCVALCKNELLQIKRAYWIVGYFMCAAIVCLMYIIGWKHTWDYSNPVVVIQSFCLFIPFIYRQYYEPWINWVAGSTFAVYIIHTCSPVSIWLMRTDRFLQESLPYILYLPSYLIVVLFIFCVCIAYDKLRLKLTTPLSEKAYGYILAKMQKLGFT